MRRETDDEYAEHTVDVPTDGGIIEVTISDRYYPLMGLGDRTTGGSEDYIILSYVPSRKVFVTHIYTADRMVLSGDYYVMSDLPLAINNLLRRAGADREIDRYLKRIAEWHARRDYRG